VVLFEDNGVLGEVLLENRNGGKRLLEALAKRQGERVLVWKADRLGRGAEAYVLAISKIERFVPIESIVEGTVLSLTEPGKVTMTMVYGGIATEEKISIKRRTGAGSRIKARDPHHWMGGPSPYGFIKVGDRMTARLIKSQEPTTGNSRLKSEERVVIYMFRTAANDHSCREISDYLNNLWIPAGKRKKRAAKRWTPGRIRNILINPLYKGVHYYGKNEVYRLPDDPHLNSRLRPVPKKNWIERRVPELAIVDAGLWERANAALRRNLSLAKSHGKRQYLLTGLIHCDICGKRNFLGTTIHGDTYYRCGGRNRGYNASGQKCESPHMHGFNLEEAVRDDVSALARWPGKHCTKPINR
jgi:site-specific DNA recombinase